MCYLIPRGVDLECGVIYLMWACRPVKISTYILQHMMPVHFYHNLKCTYLSMITLKEISWIDKEIKQYPDIILFKLCDECVLMCSISTP